MPTYRLKRIAGNVLFFIGLVLVGATAAWAIGQACDLDKSSRFWLGLFCGIPGGILTANRISGQQHDDWMKGIR